MHIGWFVEITLHFILCLVFILLYWRQFRTRRRQHGRLAPGTRLRGPTQNLFFWVGFIVLCLQLFRAVDSCGVWGIFSWQILSVVDSNLSGLFFLCGAGLIYYTSSYYTSLLQRRQSFFLRYTCILLTVLNFIQGDVVPFLASSYPHLIAYSLLWSASTFLILAICVHWSVYALRRSINEFTKLYGAPFTLENQIPKHLNGSSENLEPDREELDLDPTDTSTSLLSADSLIPPPSLQPMTSPSRSRPYSRSVSTSINSIDGGQSVISSLSTQEENKDADEVLQLSEGASAVGALKRLTSMLTTLKRFQYLTTAVVLVVIAFQLVNGLTQLDVVKVWSWSTDLPDPNTYTPTVGLSNWAQWLGLSVVVWYSWQEENSRKDMNKAVAASSSASVSVVSVDSSTSDYDSVPVPVPQTTSSIPIKSLV